MKDKVNSLLKQTQQIIKKHDAIDKERGDRFNIFTILERDRSETRHSRMLAEMLNPKGSHGQGNIYLKAFFELFEKKIKNCWITNVTFYADEFVKEAHVDTEQHHVTDSNSGYIDIIIESHSHAVIIENKIGAPDQKNQLERYVQSKLSKHKNVLVIYLTTDGSEPSTDSVGIIDDPKKIVLLSYATDIIKWIEQCIILSNELPTIRETLIQYDKLIRKITNQNEEKMNNEIIELLLIEENIREADTICKSLPKAKAKIEFRFWKNLELLMIPILFNLGFEHWEKDDETILSEILNRKKRGEVIFEFFWRNELSPNVFLNFGVGADGEDQRLYIIHYFCDNECNPIDDSHLKFKNILNNFFDNGDYTYYGNKVNFYGDGIFELTNQNKCDELVKQSIESLTPILASLKEKIEEAIKK